MSDKTITELPDELRSVMRREVNRGLMVAFINDDLLNRAHLDVRTSTVLYDEGGVFELAIKELQLNSELSEALYMAGIRYFTKGI